jgi:murein DD-endopeptidase MepM/ murein hydrolase activator NlpD
MAWKEIPEGRRAALAVLALPLLLANCTNSPETVFKWDVNDRLARVTVAPGQPRTLVASTTKGSEDYAPYNQNPNYVAIPRQKPAVAAVASRANVEVRASEPVSGVASFQWPVSGRVISSFGATLQGERNDGINIATPLGTPIHAAAGGTISYAGNELKGYGNLVLIRHSNGYVTAYAHADRLTVSRGDTVLKGEIIGYAGSTGDVDTPQLHFEIRKGVTPVNPQPLLVASR